MCGIVGARGDWLRSRGLEPAAAIRAAVASMRWRGADGDGSVPAGGWWLGCARLAISGEHGAQPVVRRGGRFAGVLNGAVTNARHLWRRLAPGVERRRQLPNDAWLPLLAAERGDVRSLADLAGHHAYAVVDAQTDALQLGQDRYGEKPLYCVTTQHGDRKRLVAFASTLGALRHLGVEVPLHIVDAASWFRYGWAPDGPGWITDAVRVGSLPERGRPWTFGPEREVCWQGLDSDAAPRREAVARPEEGGLRHHLHKAVEGCLDTPSRVGLSLSGGIDSSCLAVLLGELQPGASAFHFRAAGEPGDERRAAREVSARAGLVLHEVEAGPEVLDTLDELTRCAGAPLGDPSVLAAHAVASAAARDGVRVLLSGEGADELLLGYRRYRALAWLRRLRWLARLRRRASPWSMTTRARYLRSAAASNPVRALLAVTPPAFGEVVLCAELGEAPCWSDRDALPETPDLALASRADDLSHYLPRDLLPKIDVAYLAAGVEGRCPFLAEEIASHGRGLEALGKRPLRRAFAHLLPRAVRRLPKRGFSLPLDRWFRGELRALDVLAEPTSRSRPHLRDGGLARAVDVHRRGDADLGHGLYLLYAFEVYLRSAAARATAGS